jgi:hypothetical protein
MVPIVTMAAETLADGPGQRPVDGEVPRLPVGRSALFAGWTRTGRPGRVRGGKRRKS